MIPKNSQEKIRVLLFDETINENHKTIFSKAHQGVFIKSEEYDFANIYEIQKPREITNEELSFFKKPKNKNKLLSYGIIVEEDKEDPSLQRLIYKKKVKVALTKGEPVFREAIDYLRSLSPLPPLQFVKEKCIPLPETEEELKDPTFLRSQVKNVRERTKIDVFFKDLIKIPEISGLLMIVDDTNKNAGKKRKALLNKELKYIGVNSKFIGKTFVAYFSFSKD